MKIFVQIKDHTKSAGLSLIALLTALALTGGFSEFTSCAISTVVSAILLISILRNRSLLLRVSLSSAVVFLVWQFYLLTALYAVDGGMALLGFVRFLPVVLFMILLMQKEQYRTALLFILPYLTAIIGLVSWLLMLLGVPGFDVDGRLSGCFQYPNTFAMFLLIGELLALKNSRKNLLNLAVAAVLFWLIILTQSRAVFVLAVIFTLLMFFGQGTRKARVILAAAVVVAGIALWALYPLLREIPIVSRFLSLSVFESTFAGRLLYWRDALPTILRHPFGAGYLGYYYLEQYIQTGVYSVRFIHNDILQLLLDVGWIPTAGVLVMMFRPIFSRKTSFAPKLVIIAFFLHICFDFDLQYTAMWFILLLLIGDPGTFSRHFELRMKKAAALPVTAVCMVLSVYFTAALGLGFFGSHRASLQLYPLNTEQRIGVLTETEDIEAMSDLADTIRRQNEFVPIAYSAKARCLFSKGDIKNMMKYKNKVFELAPFNYDEYEEYAGMLIYCIELYEQSGDTNGAELCKKELIATRDKLTALNDRLSYFGRIIQDQPTTRLPDEINNYIDSISE